MSDGPALGLAFVGTGQRARSYLRELPHLRAAHLVALCDTNEHRLRAFAADLKLEATQLETDLRRVLDNRRVEAVVICVPDSLHRQVAVQCFQAGKHVLLEKPMALTGADCQAIIAARRQAGTVLTMGFVLRATRFYRAIHETVASGRLGQVMGVSAAESLGMAHSASFMRRWHRHSSRSGGFLLTKCSHDIDILNWVVGAKASRVASFGGCDFFLPRKQPATHCSKCPETASCPFVFNPRGAFVYLTPDDVANPSTNDFDLCVYNPDKDMVDNQVCIIEYANGVRATFALQLFLPSTLSSRTITIHGQKGVLRAESDNPVIRVHYNDAAGRVEEIDGSPRDSSGHGGGDRGLLQDFIDAALLGQPVCGDETDGLRSTVVCHALEESRKTGAVVTIDPASLDPA